MILITGLILSFIVGISALFAITRRLNAAEALGLSFPIGIAIQTFIMIVLDSIYIPLNALSISLASLAISGLCWWICYRKRDEVAEWFGRMKAERLPRINWCWILFITALVVMEVMNFSRTIYFPTVDRDSIAGFDLYGKVIAFEETLKGMSLFWGENYESSRSAGSYITYTPFVHCSYAYVYMFGAATSKVVNALFYACFIVAFYGLMSRFVTHTLTAIVTFFLFLSPEFLSFSAMSGTNVLHAYFASLGVLFFLCYRYKGESSLLWVSALLLFFNFWTRNEGAVFIAPVFAVMLWDAAHKRGSYKKALCYLLFTISPFILWNLFLSVFDMQGKQVFIARIFWDPEKFNTIISEVWTLFKLFPYYGMTIPLFAAIIILNLYNIIRRGDQMATLFLIFSSLALYTIIIYQIDYVWDSIINVLRFSYKRFLFCFLPIIWFYIASNRLVSGLFLRLDRFVYGKE